MSATESGGAEERRARAPSSFAQPAAAARLVRAVRSDGQLERADRAGPALVEDEQVALASAGRQRDRDRARPPGVAACPGPPERKTTRGPVSGCVGATSRRAKRSTVPGTAPLRSSGTRVAGALERPNRRRCTAARRPARAARGAARGRRATASEGRRDGEEGSRRRFMRQPQNVRPRWRRDSIRRCPQRETVDAPGAPAAVGAYSHAVQAGDLLFCSGQVALDAETGELVGDTAGEQARRCLENLRPSARRRARRSTAPSAAASTSPTWPARGPRSTRSTRSFFRRDPPARAADRRRRAAEGRAGRGRRDRRAASR